MDDLADEKKPFDHELAKDEDDSQPDPEEILNMDQGGGRVWSVKVTGRPGVPHDVLNADRRAPRSPRTSWRSGSK